MYDYERCIQGYKRLLKEIPDERDRYNHRLAVCYRNIGKNIEAIRHLDNIKDKNNEIIQEKARALLAEKSDSALELFEQTISEDQPQTLKETGFAYLQFSMNKKALSYFLKYHSLTGDDSDVIFEISQIYYFLRDFEKSMEFLLIYENTRGADRLLFLKRKALIEESLGRFKEAEKIFSEVLSIEPEDSISFEHIVMLYENAGKQNDLLKILLNREKIFPLDLEIKKKIGRIYLDTGDLKKSRIYFGILVENNYYDRDFIQDYLNLCLQYKDYDKAESIALKLTDSGSFSKDELAEFFTKIYFKTGRINLSGKYVNYIEDKKIAGIWKDKIRTLDGDNIFTLFHTKENHYNLKTLCSGTVIDKVVSDDIEIIKNYIKNKEKGIVIYSGYSDLLNNVSIRFDVNDILDLINIKHKDIENTDDILDVIKQVTTYFDKNKEVFRAFLNSANEATVKILLFLNKTLNISLSAFCIDEFLAKEYDVIQKKDKINLNITSQNNSVFKEKNIWYNYSDNRLLLSFFENHAENHTGKSVIFVDNIKIAENQLEFINNYSEFSIFYGDYICLNHFGKYSSKDPENTKKIIFWLPFTQTGSLKEISVYDKSIVADERNCLQLECPYYEKCFFQKIRKDIFMRKYVVSEYKNKDYFMEKFESAFYFITPDIIESIVNGDIYSFAQNTDNLIELDSFLENILVNSQDSFSFYRKIKESIIRITRLEERILKVFSDTDISQSIKVSFIDSIFSDFSVYLKRYAVSLDTLSEDLYDIEKYANPAKINVVEINFQRNRLNDQRKIFNKIIADNSDYWVRIECGELFIISENWYKDIFRTNIYINCYENIRRVSTFLSRLFDVTKIIDNECELEKRKEFKNNSVFLDRIGKYSAFIINYLYSEVLEISDNLKISEFLSDNSEVRENIKDLFRDNTIHVKQKDFLNLMFATAYSGKTTVLCSQDVELKKHIYKSGIPYVEIYSIDTEMEKKLKNNLIRSNIYNIVIIEDLRDLTVNAVYVFTDNDSIDNYESFRIYLERESNKTNKDIAFFMSDFILNDTKNNIILSEDQLKNVFLEDAEVVIEHFYKNRNIKKIISRKPEINTTGLTQNIKDILFRNYTGILNKNSFKLIYSETDAEIFDVLYFINRSGFPVSQEYSFVLKKEISSSTDIIYRNLLNVVEGLEYFNSFDEIRVFGKKDFPLDTFDFKDNFFFWLFYLKRYGYLSIDFNEQNISIQFVKKIETVIKFVKEEFERFSYLLKILNGAYGVDINTRTDINIFQLFAEFEDTGIDSLAIMLNALNFMKIIDSEPLRNYFQRIYQVKITS